MSDEHLDPAKSIIAKCGGVDAVALITGKHVSRVYRWMYSKERGGTGGFIPREEASKLLAHAEREKIDLSPSEFFGASSLPAADDDGATSKPRPELPRPARVASIAVLALAASLYLSADHVGGVPGEQLASLGIDLQAARGAPEYELLRVDYSANDDKAAAFDAALHTVEELEEIVVAPGQNVRIVHDLENARIVLASVPADASDSGPHGPAT